MTEKFELDLDFDPALERLLDIAFDEGVDAYCDDKLITDNPYPRSTDLAEAWADGWTHEATPIRSYN